MTYYDAWISDPESVPGLLAPEASTSPDKLRSPLFPGTCCGETLPDFS